MEGAVRDIDYGVATFATHIAMGAWFPICMILYILFKPVRAACIGVIAGLLFLPNASYDLPGLPAYDKTMAIGAGVLVAALFFDTKRVLSFRPGLVDIPVACLCFIPVISSVLNEFGAYDGFASAFVFVIRWAVPWFLGRIYLRDPESLNYFGYAAMAGALAYVPLCLFEIQMSPMLHKIVYGIKLGSFKHADRGMFWRPNVFMYHGLQLSLYLGCSTLIAFWYWISGIRREVFSIPITGVFGILGITTILTFSANAILMTIVGVGVLWCSRQFRWAFPVLILVMIAPTYIGVRYFADWDGSQLTDAADHVFGRERAYSLKFRFDNEIYLARRAKHQPWFGFRDVNDFTGNTPEKHMATIDSIWILYLGVNGILAVIALYLFLLAPPFLLWRNIPPAFWAHPAFAGTAVLALMVVLLALDFLLNAHENPIFTVGAGGVSGFLGTRAGRALWKG